MKRLHQFIQDNNMSLSKAPQMPFTIHKLRERHRKLLRNIFAPENKKDLDYKNYESTDSDLIEEATKPRVTQQMLDECDNFLKKRRLEKKFKDQEEKERIRKENLRGRGGKRSFYQEDQKKGAVITHDDLKLLNAQLKIYPKLHKLEDLPVPESVWDEATSIP